MNNKYLIKIISSYIFEKLPYIKELQNKTKEILYVSDNVYFYDKCFIYIDDLDIKFEIGNRKLSITNLKYKTGWYLRISIIYLIGIFVISNIF